MAAATRPLAVLSAVLLGASLGATAGASASPLQAPSLTPIDPQRVQDQQDMTWSDYRPIPGVDWATNGAVPTQRAVRVALVAVDFPDQPFVLTRPAQSDPFGNPQIDPVTRDQVPRFYADFFNKPSPVNNFHTINGYWMEQSGGRIGVSSVTPFGPYRLPKRGRTCTTTSTGWPSRCRVRAGRPSPTTT